MLNFIGLGLFDERSVTLEGAEAIQAADRVFAEFYTSRLIEADVDCLEDYHGVDIEVRDRDGIEGNPEPILTAADSGTAAFLTAGDPMVSTTHVDLRLRAEDRGIDTGVIHGVTAESAASGLTGLQNYRFGKAVTLPFPYAHGGDGVPESVIETIEANRQRGLHTLVYLDIKIGTGPTGPDPDHEEYMSGDVAADLLSRHWGDELGVVVARAGSPSPVVAADRLSVLAEGTFGEPLHLLVIPGELHHIEADALVTFGGAPEALVE